MLQPQYPSIRAKPNNSRSKDMAIPMPKPRICQKVKNRVFIRILLTVITYYTLRYVQIVWIVWEKNESKLGGKTGEMLKNTKTSSNF